MNRQEMKNIINQYFDNELNKNEEVILFTGLSQNEEARTQFKEMNLLRNVMDNSLETFPSELDSKILSKIKLLEEVNKEDIKVIEPRTNKSTIFALISYGFAIVLLALSIFFYTESIQYKNKLELTHHHAIQQNQMIQILFNSLPQAEVRGVFENEIIITSQM